MKYLGATRALVGDSIEDDVRRWSWWICRTSCFLVNVSVREEITVRLGLHP